MKQGIKKYNNSGIKTKKSLDIFKVSVIIVNVNKRNQNNFKKKERGVYYDKGSYV